VGGLGLFVCLGWDGWRLGDWGFILRERFLFIHNEIHVIKPRCRRPRSQGLNPLTRRLTECVRVSCCRSNNCSVVKVSMQREPESAPGFGRRSMLLNRRSVPVQAATKKTIPGRSSVTHGRETAGPGASNNAGPAAADSARLSAAANWGGSRPMAPLASNSRLDITPHRRVVPGRLSSEDLVEYRYSQQATYFLDDCDNPLCCPSTEDCEPP
jgi:hypothetical protein